ncbi:hypothetical protein I2I05_04310 [Hymenobacter sp. BT683]|uniref:CopG family transcriptional regulator n=1 Tax=Hymenobacter jeongseonensis TaxID=2791027 RepID=A0ABS0IE45_9BACT|nr:hypothetical protein [Hymenobacter jeongseonensis]MBF9236612.1 hypothetical protein [Hymenobacter jeongseonensis]
MNNQPTTPERKLCKTITLTTSVHTDLTTMAKRLGLEYDRRVAASEAIRILLTAYEAAT